MSPVGVASSGGGTVPGCLLQLLVGVPLQMWRDYRAPGLAVVLAHLLAVAVLIGTLGRALGLRFLTLFLAVYWLSPWRTYHSGFLWNPNFLFLPAALHLGCTWQLRKEKRVLPSAVLAAAIVLAMQLHASFLILAVASAILIWRKLTQLHWRGALLGCAVGSLTLIPTAIAFFRGALPKIVPHTAEGVSALILPIQNFGKALMYWFRFGSPEVGRRLGDTVYLSSDPLDAAPFLPVPSVLVSVIVILGLVAVAIPIRAAWMFLRPSNLRGKVHSSDVAWLRAYALCFLVALLAVAVISPSSLQAWHLIISLHAACIPVALFLQYCLDAQTKWLRSIPALFLALQICVVLLVASGNKMYLRRVYLWEDRIVPENVQRLIPHFDTAARRIPRP